MPRRLAGECYRTRLAFVALLCDSTEFEVSVDGTVSSHQGRPALVGLIEDLSDRQMRLDSHHIGGLRIIATERHESRRIDNQLRGRSGRQGDPGVSRFYLSLEDPLMRLFASDRIKNMMRSMGMEQGESIEHSMVTNAIVKAQRKVEGRNFDIRKQLLEYDDVANDQRRIIYRQRDSLLGEDEVTETITQIRADVVNGSIDSFIPPMSVEEQWDVPGLERQLEAEFGVTLPLQAWLEENKGLHEESLRDRIVEEVQAAYDTKASVVGDGMRQLEKQIMLQVLDTLWKEHLATMDQLRQGIHLRGYAQKQPKQEYKREAFELFGQLLDMVKNEVTRVLMTVQIESTEQVQLAADQLEEKAEAISNITYSAPDETGAAHVFADNAQEAQNAVPAVGRNEACPCGSGKKYKHCCEGKVLSRPAAPAPTTSSPASARPSRPRPKSARSPCPSSNSWKSPAPSAPAPASSSWTSRPPRLVCKKLSRWKILSAN